MILCSCRCYIIIRSVAILCLTITKTNGGKECLINYKFDESSQKCIECPIGFFGPGCSLLCQPPNYGQLCVKMCKCSHDQCDKIIGCSQGQQESPSSTDITLRAPFSKTTNNNQGGLKNGVSKFFSTITGSVKSSSSPVRKHSTYKLSVLITVSGTFISTLLLVAIGFQLRKFFCRKESRHQLQISCENGNVYAEAQNIDN